MNCRSTLFNFRDLSGTPVFPARFLLLLLFPLISVDSTAGSGHHHYSSQPTELEHIIVTAERRETNLQDTPVSITAFTADDIHDMGITEVPDLALRTPGLTLGNGGNMSFPVISLRGVGTADFSVAGDLSIGFYVDDVYIARGGNMFMDLFDVEQIEILRGPQGTLWGRNTIGGAIHVITSKPTNEFTMSHKLRLGNFDLLHVSGTASGPLIKDKLLAKFSYNVRDRDGYAQNVFNDNDVGDAENVSVRGNVQFFPADDLSFTLNLDYSKDRPTATAFNPTITGDPILFGVAGNITVRDPPFNHIEPDGAFRVNHNEHTREHRDIKGVSGKIVWEADDFQFTAISSYRQFDFDQLDNTDGLSIQLLNIVQETEQEQFSQEFRISNKDTSVISWLFGGYFFHEETTDQISTVLQDLSLLFGPVDFSSTNFSNADANSYSIFGQLNYRFNKRLSATLGFRYTYEERDFETRRVSNDVVGLLDPSFPLTLSDDDWRAFTPKLGIEYRYSENQLYYFSVSRGFRSGGFNSFQSQLQDSFAPEFLTAYEVGLKSAWLDRRLQLNLAAFYYDHSDRQVETLVPTGGGVVQTVTTNAAESEDYGFEAELIAIPFHGLSINASFAYLDAEYKEFINGDGIDVSGNIIADSPEFSTNFGIQYTFLLGRCGLLSIRGEHQYQSKIFFTETNDNVLSQGGYHNFNTRLEYTHNKKISLAAFAKNLTDEETANHGLDFRGLFGIVNQAFNPPRTYGVELIYRY